QISAATPPAQANYYHDSMRAMTENLLRLSREQWDLLMFVNGATDGAQHRFFKFVVPDYPGVRTADRARYGSLLAELMIAADAELGRLLEHLPPNVNILVISDHGAIVRPRLAFNLNAWLAQEGFLTTRKAQAGSRRFGQTMVEWARQRLPINEWVKRHLPRPLKQQVTAVRSGLSHIEWAQTQAYRVKLSHPIEGIHLNLAGRQAQGVVNPPDYTKIRDAIIERLNQRPEVVAVHPREAIHHGPYLDNVPDILVQLRPEYDGGADFHQLVTTIPASWLKSISGYHALPGILVAAGPDVRPGRPAPVDLVDITPTALHLLNVPVPADLDGRVLQELLATERPVEYADGKMPGVSGLATALSAAETAGILATLRDLGYVE
ncbi:MAG: alkaline phosphatase family protein, partial [Chloroflexota bacterium]